MRKLLPVLLVLCFALLDIGRAEEYALDLKKIKLNKKNAAVFPEIELRPCVTTKLSREPKYRSNEPQKFVARFGDGDGIEVVFAVDEKKGNGKGYDYLYVDRAGTGDLSRGKKLNGKIVARGSSYVDAHFPPFEIEMPGDDGAVAIPMQARFSCRRGSTSESSLYLTPLCFLTGTVAFAGKNRKIFVFDADCNGLFGDSGSPGGTSPRGDRIWIGKRAAKAKQACIEALPIGRYFYCDGDYYELVFKGNTLSVTKADVPLGTIKVDNPGFILELVQGGDVLYVSNSEGDTIKVPTGRYRINTAGFRRKHKGKLWELVGEPGSCRETLSVREGAESSVALGAPVKIMVTSTMRTVGTGLVASLSFFIEGSGGERYKYLLMGGKKVDLPDISIRNGGNREVHKGHFEYG